MKFNKRTFDVDAFEILCFMKLFQRFHQTYKMYHQTYR